MKEKDLIQMLDKAFKERQDEAVFYYTGFPSQSYLDSIRSEDVERHRYTVLIDGDVNFRKIARTLLRLMSEEVE